MTYAEQHAALVRYLRAKAEQADWHAVRDAAVDLEIMEAENRKVPRLCRRGVDPPLLVPPNDGQCRQYKELVTRHGIEFCVLDSGHAGEHEWPLG